MDILKQLEKSDQFASIDHHFAAFIIEMSAQTDPILALSAALASRSNREGDVCIDLTQLAGDPDESIAGAGDGLPYPDIRKWRHCLQASPVVGKPGDYTPLILDNKDRLYLHRYWEYEKYLIEAIQAKSRADINGVDDAVLRRDLSDIFPETHESDVDWQKIAAAVAAVKRFCVISGGPGTGKTYAIARILATLIKQAQPTVLRINLTAPTGKAAARLAESVQAAKSSLGLDPRILASIPETGSTIHRLLKPIKGSPYFRYNSENPLPADVVIVDEASMVDLPLMSKLMQALSDDTRIILMGDRHQLASVEAGSILGDICGRKIENGYSPKFVGRLASVTEVSKDAVLNPAADASAIFDNLVYFTRNYRFEGGSGISRLSQAVNAGRADEVMHILKNGRFRELTWYPLEISHAHTLLRHQIQAYYGRLQGLEDPSEGLAVLNRFRILCAVNQGPLGVNVLNDLAMQTVLKTNRGDGISKVQAWYHGRPVLITANDYELSLFNGEVGFAARTERTGQSRLQIYFAQGPSGELRCFSPARLPSHQSVYAMTVHKSQGSEFDDVLLVLPELDTPLLTRELLYTGITRTRRNLSILASESVIRSAVSRRIERTSGLRDALWGPE